MKKILVAVVLLASCCGFARADEASKEAKAEKLISVMHMDAMIDQMRDLVKGQMSQMESAMPEMSKLNPKQQQITKDFMNKMTDLTMNEVGSDKMKRLMAGAYAKTFTEEELDAMIGFYSSPVGQSVVVKMPQVMQNTMSMVQGVMGDLIPKVQALTEDYKKQLAAAGPVPQA